MSTEESATASPARSIEGLEQVDQGTTRFSSIGRFDVVQLRELVTELLGLFNGAVQEHWVYRAEEGSQSKSASRVTRIVREISATSWDTLREWFIRDGTILVVRNLELQLSDTSHHLALEFGAVRTRGGSNSRIVRLTVTEPAGGQMFAKVHDLLLDRTREASSLYLKTVLAWIVVPFTCGALFYGPVDRAVKAGYTGEELANMIGPPISGGSLLILLMLLIIWVRARSISATCIVGDWQVNTPQVRMRNYFAKTSEWWGEWWRKSSKFDKLMATVALLGTIGTLLQLFQ